jgi:hypothetical protein
MCVPYLKLDKIMPVYGDILYVVLAFYGSFYFLTKDLGYFVPEML